MRTLGSPCRPPNKITLSSLIMSPLLAVASIVPPGEKETTSTMVENPSMVNRHFVDSEYQILDAIDASSGKALSIASKRHASDLLGMPTYFDRAVKD
jgi:hypothetical protein